MHASIHPSIHACIHPCVHADRHDMTWHDMTLHYIHIIQYNMLHVSFFCSFYSNLSQSLFSRVNRPKCPSFKHRTWHGIRRGLHGSCEGKEPMQLQACKKCWGSNCKSTHFISMPALQLLGMLKNGKQRFIAWEWWSWTRWRKMQWPTTRAWQFVPKSPNCRNPWPSMGIWVDLRCPRTDSPTVPPSRYVKGWHSGRWSFAYCRTCSSVMSHGMKSFTTLALQAWGRSGTLGAQLVTHFICCRYQ